MPPWIDGGKPERTDGATSRSDTMMGGFGRRMAAMAAVGMLATAMMGSEVTSQYYAYGKKSGAASVFTTDGLAHAKTFNTFEVVVTSTQIIYDFGVTLSSGTWSASASSLNQDGLSIRSGNLLSFTDAPDITGVTIDAATTMAGLTAANVTFNNHAVAIDWMGRAYNSGTRVVLNVATAPSSPTAVSEPPALAMAGLAAFGLLGSIGARRREGAKLA
jgi:hypothetical protein